MTDRKRGRKTKYRLPQNWRSTAAALLILFVMLGCICSRYVSFVSQTVYQESTSHLSELVHKSDNMLGHLVRRNRTLLHLWNDCMKNDLSEEQIRASLNEMQEETGCAALYFLASDGRKRPKRRKAEKRQPKSESSAKRQASPSSRLMDAQRLLYTIFGDSYRRGRTEKSGYSSTSQLSGSSQSCWRRSRAMSCWVSRSASPLTAWPGRNFCCSSITAARVWEP